MAVRPRYAVQGLTKLYEHQLLFTHVPKTHGALALLADLLACLYEGFHRSLEVGFRVSG